MLSSTSLPRSRSTSGRRGRGGSPVKNLARLSNYLHEWDVQKAKLWSAVGRALRGAVFTGALTLWAYGLTTVAARAALAQPTERLAYSQQQVYSAAVRYLRIDLRYEITERDPEAAYLLFEYQPLGQKGTRFGAVEIVKLQQGVRLAVRMPDQPSYQEAMLRDGLVKKLRSDYGEMAPSKPDKAADAPSTDDAPSKGNKEPEKKPKADRPNARS